MDTPPPIAPSTLNSAAVLCVACGYDLRGTKSGRCPECGAPVVVGGTRFGAWDPNWRWSHLLIRLIGAHGLAWLAFGCFLLGKSGFSIGAILCTGAVVAMLFNSVSLAHPAAWLYRSNKALGPESTDIFAAIAILFAAQVIAFLIVAIGFAGVSWLLP